MSAGPGAPADAAAGEQRCQDELGHILGQRRDRGQDQCRRTTEKHRHRQLLAPFRCARVVEAAALADLPVHARRPRVVDLHPVDPEVVAGSVGIFGVNEGQSQEGATVLGPRGDDRQPAEIDATGLYFAHRPRSGRLCTKPQTRGHQVPRRPQRSQVGRKRPLDELDGSTHELRRATAEGHLRPTSSAKEIGREREIAALDPGKQKRRSAGRDDPPMDLRHLEPRINRRFNLCNITVAAELRDKRSQVGETHFVHPREHSISCKSTVSIVLEVQ